MSCSARPCGPRWSGAMMVTWTLRAELVGRLMKSQRGNEVGWSIRGLGCWSWKASCHMDWRRQQVGRHLFGPVGECRRAGCPAASARHWLFCRIGWRLGRGCSLEATVDILWTATIAISIVVTMATIVAGCSGECWLIASTIESEDRLRSAFSPACCPVSDSRHPSSAFHCWYLPFHFEFGSWLGSFGCLRMQGFWIQSICHLKQQLVSCLVVLVLAFYRWNQMYCRPWLGCLSVTSSSIKYSIKIKLKAGLCLICHLVLDFEYLGFWVHFARWQESASWLTPVKAEKHC